MKKNILSTLILVMILTSGCTLPTAATPTPEPTITPTATATFTAVPPTATATLTSVPTATTILETSTPAATITNVPTKAACVYSATVTGEDPQNGHEYAAKETFTKTWTLKNSGTCAWDGTSWRLTAAHAAGDADFADDSSYKMDESSNPKKSVIIVGDSISVSINMHAPDQWGTFTQNWQIVNSDTNQIMSISYGSGTPGQTMIARIVVPESGGGGGTGGGAAPTVEIQTVSMQSGTSSCTSDAQYNIAAKIIGKAKAQVSYTVSANDGTASDAGATVTLNNKGGYDINTSITSPYSDPGNVQVTITVLVDGVAVNYASVSICADGAYQQ